MSPTSTHKLLIAKLAISNQQSTPPYYDRFATVSLSYVKAYINIVNKKLFVFQSVGWFVAYE